MEYQGFCFVFHQFINHLFQLVADLLEKRAPFNGMRGKRGEEMAVQQPDQVNILMLMLMMVEVMTCCKMCSLVEVI